MLALFPGLPLRSDALLRAYPAVQRNGMLEPVRLLPHGREWAGRAIGRIPETPGHVNPVPESGSGLR
jgi:hypothetical protein